MGPVRHRVDSLHRISPRSLERGIIPLVDKIMYGNEEVLPEPSRETKFQACTRIAEQPEVSVLVPSRTHLERC